MERQDAGSKPGHRDKETGATGDLLATTDLGTLVQQFARRCYADLASALGAAASSVAAEDEGRVENAHQDARGDAREALVSSLEQAREGLLRLSILIHAASSKEGALETGLEEAGRTHRLRQHAFLVRRCSERDRMGRDREELVAGLATRQHDVNAALTMLCSYGNTSGEPPSNLNDVGWPPLMAEMLASMDATATAGREEEVILGAWCCIAESTCPKDPDQLQVEICRNTRSIHFVAPGAFSVYATYDLRRWSITQASVAPCQAKGIKVGPEVTESLRKRLQLAVDAKPIDAPKALFDEAHAFCSHMWLRIAYNGALEVPAARRSEVSLVHWDQKKNVLRLRICSHWDPTCKGMLQDVLDSQLGEDKLMNAASEVFMSGGGIVAGRRSGCLVQLSADPAGGLLVGTQPELSLSSVAPQLLEEHGSAFLEHICMQCRLAFATRYFQRLQGALQPTPNAMRAGRMDVFQDAYGVERCKVLPDSGILQVTVDGCVVDVTMEATGRLCMQSGGCSEACGGEASDALPGGREGFVARLRSARWEALCAAVSAEASARGWMCADFPSLPELAVGQAEGQRPADGARKHERRFAFGLDGHPFALTFNLLETEVARPALFLQPRASGEAAATVLLQPVPVEVEGLEPFTFGGRSQGSNAIASLSEGLQPWFSVARQAIEGMPFGAAVLEHLAQHSVSILGLSSITAGKFPWALRAKCLAAGLECKVEWPISQPPTQSVPFVPPLLVSVQERAKRWKLGGTLRHELCLVPGEEPKDALDLRRFASGGRLHMAQVETRSGAQGVLRGANLEYDYTDLWRQWPGDLEALAIFTTLAAQASAGPWRAHLELCCPGLLRFRLPGLTAGLTRDEVFELIWQSWAARPQSGTTTPANMTTLPCKFRWLEPTPQFVLAEELSQVICTTCDLGQALHSITAAAELVRAVQELREREKVWSVRALGRNTVAVEFKEQAYCRKGHALEAGPVGGQLCMACQSNCATHRCSRGCEYGLCPSCHVEACREARVLGVGLEAVAVGELRCRCLAAEQLSKGTMARLPSLDMFVSGHLALGKAPTPGRLAALLTPLWAYLRCYHVLWGMWVMMTQRDIGKGSDDKGAFLSLGPAVDRKMPQGSWAALNWRLPALTGAVCGVALTSRRSSLARRRSDIQASEPPPKRACNQDDQPPTEVCLRFYGALEVEGEFHCELSGERAGMVWRTGEADREKEVLKNFEVYMQQLLGNAHALRATRLQPPFSLLGAPCLWMQEEIGEVLQSGLGWEPMPQYFALAQVEAHSQGQQRWQFHFVLAAKQPPVAVHSLTCCANVVADRSVQGGWDEVRVDGKGLPGWADGLPDGCDAKQLLLFEEPPYSLAKLLQPIVEAFGHGP